MHSQKAFQILNTIDNQEITSQRQLAEATGISLGHINYVLRLFYKKGLIKLKNFRKNPYKIQYIYSLTPKGIEEKSKLAYGFVLQRLNEYNMLKAQVTHRLQTIAEAGHQKIVFVGPDTVFDLIKSIIKDSDLDIELTGTCKEMAALPDFPEETYAAALVFSHPEKTDPLDHPENIYNLW